MESSSIDPAPVIVAVPPEDAVLPAPISLPVVTDVTAVAVAVLQQHQQLVQAARASVLLLESVAVQYALELEQTETEDSQQPLKEIFGAHSVAISAHNEDREGLYKTLTQLEQLIHACTESPSNFGRSPGWDLQINAQHQDAWTCNQSLPLYESLQVILPQDTNLPLPSPQSAKRVYEKVKEAIEVRLQYLLQSSSFKSEYCSCISTWWNDQVAVRQIVNQVMEQAMTEHATYYLHQNLPFHTWDATYGPSNNYSKNTSLDRLDSPIQLISHRDLYMNVLVQALLAARHSVFISTCYLFHEDPASLYLLFDVVPTLLQSGIQVYFMMDLFVFESNMLSSPFRVQPQTTSPCKAPASALNQDGSVTLCSFLNNLPPHSPKQTRRRFESQYHVFDTLLQQSNAHPNFYMSFWCARDSNSGYRIKNHSKGIVIDDQWAMFGGSNLAPNIRTATGDLDCVVTGPAAKAIGDSFWKLWQAVNGDDSRRSAISHNALLTAALAQGAKESLLSGGSTSTGNTVVPGCTMSLLQSTPSSAGDDCIYRGVLEHIEMAKEAITISMGHCCFPQSFVCALVRAASRGVATIQILVNSFHSNDLRCGQRDLFLSISSLLQQVPSAQIYATHAPSDNPTVRPDFLHGKYVIVDGAWAALGSWNLWTRSAFYELEMELFIDSAEVAAILQSKFDADRAKASVLVELQDCEPGGKFCPKGCPLCQGFGPFFEKS